MSDPKRLGIPSLDEVNDPTRRVLEPLKELVEIREGRRGNPRQAFVTFQDLIDLELKTESEVDDYLESR
jgi:hypothetical protein